MPVPAMRIFWEAMLPSDEDVRSFKLARALNASLRHAHEEMGRFWHENILPNHFGAAGKVRYHYQPRSERYKRWKQRSQGKLRWARLPGGQRYQYRVVGGADDDNILSGRLRDKMIGSPAAYRAFPSRVTVTMPTLPYIFRPNTRGGSRQPDKNREITATFDARDARDLASVFEAAFWKHWRGRLRRKRLVIDGGRISRLV